MKRKDERKMEGKRVKQGGRKRKAKKCISGNVWTSREEGILFSKLKNESKKCSKNQTTLNKLSSCDKSCN